MFATINKNLVLKILIVLGIFGIAASLYIKYGKPYLHERALYAMDEQRIRDIDALNKEIENILSASSTTKLGEDNTVYISIPSDDPSCGDLDLPSLAEGWKYHCSSKENYQKTDGTGWIPIDLKSNKIITVLPIDPKNNATELNYYSFLKGSADLYSIITNASSDQFYSSAIFKNKLTFPKQYITGNSTTLPLIAQGAIGAWPINDGGYEAANILTRNKQPGIILSSLWEQEDGRLILNFNENNFIKIFDEQLTKIGNKECQSYSIVLSFKTSKRADQSITENWSSQNYPWAIRGPMTDGSVSFGVYNSSINSGAAVRTNKINTSDEKWHSLIAIRDNQAKRLRLFIDGILADEAIDPTADTDVSGSGPFILGARYDNGDKGFAGSIKDLIIYRRILSLEEIDKYNINR